ncbi:MULTISPECIES: catalase/peroxidase HPI [unclassified Francisella]|uniref:catalase/peroxidase HPI n=1 Tax=unclassified Francisella TaxID=2610885 RepID=UPI002E330BEB|nr:MULTISPECIES: catalase/peroxidase HPI [unclassified Francisella]MED7818396.1 catalase/peroxidase HPI [Francisella sp. 19S2-4]MED7829232.1 catalase/peroxidase HPI [Francisella sp. 19S2-10]
MVKKIVTAIGMSGMLLSGDSAFAENKDSLSPQSVNLSPLRNLNTIDSPMGKNYSYREAFKKLDTEQLKKDMQNLLTQSQDWWPADFGNYGPFFIRLSWHDAGTYRIFDGRGGANRGQQRFSPLNSWPDNVNLDKARQLLWPIKQKYGNAVSWSDLIVLAGTVSLESMGMKPIGFAFGREDDWQGDDTNWGVSPEELSSNVKNGKLETPYSATQMGLIYVNPEGPDGKPDVKKAGDAIRQAFSGMGMTDKETVALIAGGHTFGKTHGAVPAKDVKKDIGPAPDKAPIEQQGFGWHNSYGTGKGDDTMGSGLEGSWTATPTYWNHDFLNNLYNLDYEKTLSPAGAHQWVATNAKPENMVPDAHKPGVKHKPIMFTTDLALKEDPKFNKYAQEFYKNPEEFKEEFAKAWFKLTHRDMGPKSRYMGPWIPKQDFIWQDPVPVADYKQVSTQDIAQLKQDIANSGLTNQQLIKTAWDSASTYRKTDYRGGSNGARIALAPEKDWQMNEPAKLEVVLAKLKEIQTNFNNSKKDGTKISLADLIVLGGNVGVEQAAKQAGYTIEIPFVPGRTDATQAQTDIESFNYLKTKADGFINYTDGSVAINQLPQALVEKASMLKLNIPEMTVLVGGMRALNVNYDDSQEGVFTATPGQLNNNFFVNLLDMSTEWKKSDTNAGEYIGVDRKTGKQKWTASPVDLIFGSNSELKAVAQVYAENGNEQKFVNDFAKAWHKVMMLGRFDVQK